MCMTYLGNEQQSKIVPDTMHHMQWNSYFIIDTLRILVNIDLIQRNESSH